VPTRGAPPRSGAIVRRGGRYYRLADPDWSDPLDSSYSRAAGGRWNMPGRFPVLYLNDTVTTARLQVLHKLAGLPYGPEDLDPDEQHDLVSVDVPTQAYLDCTSDKGLTKVGLPASYPRHANGRTVTHATCQPSGKRAWDNQLPGIACRSAAAGATKTNDELAYFDRDGRPRPTFRTRTSFGEWWWQFDSSTAS
jgi:RES domain-containing protein